MEKKVQFLGTEDGRLSRLQEVVGMDAESGLGWERTLINDRYEIVRELGAGGSGCVYTARDRVTEKRVAVKLLGRHVQWDRTTREKFELEARVAGRVESEHIVEVLDAGLDPKTRLPYLVMELLKGKNLQELVEQEGRVSPALALEYLRQVASGLDKAHAWQDSDDRPAPIVHRDLKPSNLFLTYREDGTPLVKILDWGIAKVLSQSATLSGDVKGTPLYMAAEQLLQAPVTTATDIWAFGLIAYYLLTGECYWKVGQMPNAVLPIVIREVSEGPTDPPSSRLRALQSDFALPAAFDQWFLRCVNLNPARRFARAGEAVQALAEVLDPLTAGSQRSSLVEGVARSSRSPVIANYKKQLSALVLAVLAGSLLAVLVARHPTSLTSSAAAVKIELVPPAAAAASSVSWQPNTPTNPSSHAPPAQSASSRANMEPKPKTLANRKLANTPAPSKVLDDISTYDRNYY